MPMPCHLTLTGEKQGKIEGSCDMKEREGTILVYELHHSIGMPASKNDGLPNAKRVHSPMTIVKEIDKASPKIFQALCTGEHLKDVTLKYYRVTKYGTEEHYYTTTLEDAIVVSYAPAIPNTLLESSEVYKHMEAVSFAYKKIKVTWEADGIEAEDSWDVPR
jgi:type VI secretion system secreted protein Hcp